MADSPTCEELCVQARKLLKDGQHAESLAAFEEARQVNDLDPDAHEGLATVHFMMQAFEDAARHFERVTRLDPRRGTAWINLGAVYNRLGKYDRAAEVLRRAVQIDRKSSAGFYNLGIAYKHLRQWNMAIPAYREAIRLDPKMADAYLNLGNVYLEMGNVAQAILQFKKALEIRPGFERAERGLARAEERLNAAKQADNPFGRLVNTESMTQAGAGDAPARELTEEERERDRRKVFEILVRAQADLHELTEWLEQQLEPSLKTLNRLLTHRASPHGVSITKAEALEMFEQAKAGYPPRLAQFRRAVQQLRDHEGNMK
jgi:tetratricopeptide (TPR) repeat protein